MDEKKTVNVNELIGEMIVFAISSFLWTVVMAISFKIHNFNIMEYGEAGMLAYGITYLIPIVLFVEDNLLDIDMAALGAKLRR